MPPSTTSEAQSVREGSLVAGKYRVGKVIGEGGMGVVLAAAHEALGTPVALKVLRPEAVLSPGMVGRFLQEARAAALLMSEHVAKVHDFGTLDDGSPYLAMEYLHGRDLAYLLHKRQRLSVAEAVEVMRQTCDAVSEAHAAGIVHRDLKPHNLFLVSRPNHAIFVKVLDFGIAKVLGSERFRVDVTTQSTAMLGTPLYMAPEQLRAAKTADGRSDIWSLGVIFHQLLSGRVPFEADTLPELSVMVMTTDAVPLDGEKLSLPDELVAIVSKCLKRDPEERFANVDELLMALDPFVSNRRVSIPDFSSPALDAITTGPRQALELNDTAFPSSRALAKSWPTSTASSMATTSTLATGHAPPSPDVPASGTRKRVVIALVGAGVLAGAALVAVFAPRGQNTPAATVQGSQSAPPPTATLPAPSVTLSASEWAAVPVPSAAAEPPTQARVGGHRDRAPRASAQAVPATAPSTSLKIGPNGSPIITD